MKRVGHKGADLIAPGNTLESFDAALAAGVDMVEFDVLPENRDGTGRLVLAHDYSALEGRAPLTLEEGLAHFAADAYAGVELDLDLKLPGYEERVVAALRAHGLADRT
ncbi:MAG: glycerophosphodiester phosphodiesterase, partial [Solirubrobacteraceae bacterium]